MPWLDISEEWLSEFEAAVERACVSCEPHYFRSKDGRSLIVSFDKDWRAFLCDSKGYNRDKDYYLDDAGPVRMMDAVASYFEQQYQKNGIRIPGGRFLFDAQNAFRPDPRMLVGLWLPRKSEILPGTIWLDEGLEKSNVPSWYPPRTRNPNKPGDSGIM